MPCLLCVSQLYIFDRVTILAPGEIHGEAIRICTCGCWARLLLLIVHGYQYIVKPTNCWHGFSPRQAHCFRLASGSIGLYRAEGGVREFGHSGGMYCHRVRRWMQANATLGCRGRLVIALCRQGGRGESVIPAKLNQGGQVTRYRVLGLCVHELG